MQGNRADMADGTGKRRRQYTLVACKECRRRKMRCDGFSTCRRCAKHGILCSYDRLAPTARQLSHITQSDEDGTAAGLSPFQVAFDHDYQTADILNDRSLCQITEDSQDNAPPTTSVGIQFEAPPVGQHRIDVLNTISPLAQDYDRGFLISPSQSLSVYNDAVSDCFSLCGMRLSKAHAFELVNDFQEEAETLYPFIDLQEIKELVENLSHCKTSSHEADRDSQTDSWNDLDDTRNRDLLRLILACTLVAKEKKKTEMSQNLMSTAEAHSFSRLRMPKIDFKDLAVATVLSIYHCQCDEMNLAWRQIGAVARLSLELGMHISNQTPRPPWTSRLFWCIYVLDRRYSFMTNLPFTFRDEDIDPKLAPPDQSSPYLLPMVTYGRLGARIIPTMPKFGSASHDVDVTTLANLEKEIDEWMQSNAEGILSTQETGTYISDIENRSKRRLHVFLSIRHNQMRISLYKHALYSAVNIAKNWYFAQLAVQHAKENVQIFDRSLTTNSYELNATQYSYFLVSSVAVLFLAVKNSSQHFGNAVREYFLGLGLLKSLCTDSAASQNLCKKVQALEAAIYGLGAQGIGSFSPVPSQLGYPEEVAQKRKPLDYTLGAIADYGSNVVEVSSTRSANSAMDAGLLLNDHNLIDLGSTRGLSEFDDELWLEPFDALSQCSAMYFDFGTIS